MKIELPTQQETNKSPDHYLEGTVFRGTINRDPAVGLVVRWNNGDKYLVNLETGKIGPANSGVVEEVLLNPKLSFGA